MTGRRPHELVLSEATMRSLAFLAGLGLTIREAFSHGPERPSLYVVWGGMMTGAFVWGKGRTFRRVDDEADE